MTSTTPDVDTITELKSAIRSALSQSERNPFDVILDRIKIYYERPCTNVLEFKRRTTKMKGDIWEQFCVMYLKASGYTDVWLLKDVPVDVLSKLNLTKKDDGIDIVATKDNGTTVLYFAVQAKYRIKSRTKPYTVLGWKQLSTFYSLCMRSGPWTRYIVMTNCDSVSRRGKKLPIDYTIALARYRAKSRIFWTEMLGDQGHTTTESTSEIKEHEEIKITEDVRTKRLLWLDKLAQKS